MRRVSSLAGSWYPDDLSELHKMFAQWQGEIPLCADEDEKSPSVILVPHAGYAYCGELAAKVFAKLQPDAYDRVIIMAPSHRCSIGNALSIEPAGEVITPLGAVCFDEATHALLSKLPYTGYVPEAHANEHAVHIILPLIQYFLPQCAETSVGALICGQWAWDMPTKRKLAKLAQALRMLCTPRTLLVISTDFTHYGKKFGYVPFTDDIEERLRVLDQQVFTACSTNDGELFENIMQRTKATVCGRSSLSLLLAMVSENTRWEQIGYKTSGALTGDFTHCVSYLGALVYADWQEPLQARVHAALSTQTTEVTTMAQGLDDESKKLLLELAHKSLECAVKHAKSYSLEGLSLPKVLLEKRAAFVTLHKDGHLRGCIGELLPTRALAEAVVARAYDAALRDNRFKAVSEDELPAIHLDISVLSVPELVASYKTIELGKHGIILQKGQHSAVFLPHVPTEQGWDLPTTLTHLSHKAGLAPTAWHDETTEFFVFTAELIEE